MLRAGPVLFLLFVAGCLLLRSPPSERERIAALLEHARAPAASMLDDVNVPAPQPRGLIFVRYGERSCQPKSGSNPVIVLQPDMKKPRVGEPVQFSIVSSWCSPRPNTTFFLAIGTRLLTPPFDLAGAGAPGCSLMVAWDSLTVLSPGGVAGFWSAAVPGQVDFEWVPRAGNVGQRWYIQAAIAAPGENAAGLLTTHVLELSIAP